jgi:hypothetical protein
MRMLSAKVKRDWTFVGAGIQRELMQGNSRGLRPPMRRFGGGGWVSYGSGEMRVG